MPKFIQKAFKSDVLNLSVLFLQRAMSRSSVPCVSDLGRIVKYKHLSIICRFHYRLNSGIVVAKICFSDRP